MKHENAKHALGDHKELAHYDMSIMVWLSAIQHSRSAKRHSKSAECYSLVAKWHAAP